MSIILLRFCYCLLLVSLFLSCQHELSLDVVNPESEGIVQKDNNGNCRQFVLNGSFTKNVDINTDNRMDVNIKVTRAGSYFIHSNIVNGFSFSATGTFNAPGEYLVGLKAEGRPLQDGNNRFTINYGTSTCEAIVEVALMPAADAVLTLVGSPVNCLNPVVSGNMVAGQPLDSTCKVALTVNVTVPGVYSIKTDRVNGYYFSGADTLKTTGEHTILLRAEGKPLVPGTDIFKVSIGTSSCSFPSSPLTPFKPVSSEYFPLSEGSYWVYDYPGYTSDSLTRKVSGTSKIENNDYVIVQEKNPFRDMTDLYFRKSGENYIELANPSKYTETISYVNGTTGEVPVLDPGAVSWTSPVYQAKASFGQVIKLRYSYVVLEPDGVAIINSHAFEHVIKLKMTVAIAAENYGEGSTGETHLFYFAKGVGLIYARLMNNQRTVYEQKIRHWVVN